MPIVDAYMAAATPAPAWPIYARADSLAYVFALAGLDSIGQSYGEVSDMESEPPLMWNANYAGPRYTFQVVLHHRVGGRLDPAGDYRMSAS